MSVKAPVSPAGLDQDMEILEVLAGHGNERDAGEGGVNWIAERLGREKSQISRALELEGVVERDPRR